jgi:hypothetical protein
MSDYSNRSVLIYDSGGLFVSLAERLARDFGSVGYFYPWENSFPDGRELMVGYGLPGVHRVKHFDKYYSKYDLIVFPDVWSGDLQEDLRRRGHRVWGAGYGSDLELNRAETKQKMELSGLDMNPWKAIKGTKELRKFLAENKNQFVKISGFRGLGETFESKTLEDSEGVILELESKYLPYTNLIPFVCENSIKSKREVGYDGFNIDGKFPKVAIFGIEKKDKAYFGMVSDYDDMPPSVIRVNEALSQFMGNYRQFFSTEIIEEEETDDEHVIDLTCRHASPAGEFYCENFTNLADILWYGSEGKLIEPETEGKYGAQLVLTSEWAVENPQRVSFPEEIRHMMKLYNHCRIDGVDWIIPQIAKMKHIGSVVAISDSPEQAVADCKEAAEKVSGFDLSFNTDALDEAFSEMVSTALVDDSEPA